MTQQTQPETRAAEAAVATKPNLKHVAITAAIGAVATVLQDVYKVPEDEAALLMGSLRQLINRLFGHETRPQ